MNNNRLLISIAMPFLLIPAKSESTEYRVDIRGETEQVEDYLAAGGTLLRANVGGLPVHFQIYIDTDRVSYEEGIEGFAPFNNYKSTDSSAFHGSVLEGPELLSTFEVVGRSYLTRLWYQNRGNNMNMLLSINSVASESIHPPATGFLFHPQEATDPFTLLGPLRGINTNVNLAGYDSGSAFNYYSYRWVNDIPVGWNVSYRPTSFVVTEVPEPTSLLLMVLGLGSMGVFSHKRKIDA